MARKSKKQITKKNAAKRLAFPLKHQPSLRAALVDAEGRSEFVIAIFADIRDFSRFSKMHESPDTAMVIKRFYLQLIDVYYVGASFFKPTGDGLLIVYPYNERTLKSVAAEVVNSTFRCLEEFPGMLAGDPMINFDTPENLGFGIARGTACCLHSGKSIIDYSGHLLNLAARLMELARPSGIVIDTTFGKEFLPQAHKDRFESAEVYVRSLAETAPVSVLLLKDSVKLSVDALSPIQVKQWKTYKYDFKVADLRKLGQPYFRIVLPEIANEAEPITVTLSYPMMHKGKVVKGYLTYMSFKKFTVLLDPSETNIRVDLHATAEILEREKVPRTRTIAFKIDYVSQT